MELRKRAFGVAIGVLLGLTILLGTWWILIFGAQGQKFANISIFFRGYTVTWGGGIIGFFWGFVFGFVAGFIIAWIYNLVNKSISKPTTT